MKIILFILCMILQSRSDAASPKFNVNDINKTKIALKKMVVTDQTIRNDIVTKTHDGKSLSQKEWQNLLKKMHMIDVENTENLKLILNKWGWPAAPKFEPEYTFTFWLLAQHADHDLAFQKLALLEFKKIIKNNKKSLKEYAYLVDRVATNQHQSQMYGTQGQCVGRKKWQAYPLVNFKKVNVYRAKMGLNDFKSYQNMMNQMCH